MSKRAVIDLGTNTFHLLIVDISDSKFDVIFKERKYVYLGENGVNTISDAAYHRGIDVLVHFKEIIAGYDDVLSIEAFGTSALRNASNSKLFVDEAFAKTGIAIEIISGDREADLIAKGVGLLYNKHKYHLVMDIGGGSVEFILGNDEITWKKSFNIGIAVLYQMFYKSEPIGADHLEELDQYLSSQLVELRKELNDCDSIDLIGAAGTFEVLSQKVKTSPQQLHKIEPKYIFDLFDEVKNLTLEERVAHPMIPESRAKYIVVGLAIITHVLALKQFETVLISPFALKEGVIAQYLD